MSQRGRVEVRSSNQKSLLILGLIAYNLAQRIDGCGQAGGESVSQSSLGYKLFFVSARGNQRS
jgi:hypothetical protein